MKTTITKRAIETVMAYTYMTDRFMARAFDKDVAQYILPIIMDKPLKIVSVTPQAIAEDFFAKGCRFDVLAVDDEGKYYNIEVQNANEGASEKRARYNCERADSLLIHKGQEYKDYPELYVIFITENDYLGYGLPIYHINRYIEEVNERFEDAEHIIYVNGAAKNPATALGRLMLDMQQSNPTMISNAVMANKMKELKEGKVFHTMCKELDMLTAEAEAKGIEKGKAEEREQAMLDLAAAYSEFITNKETITKKLMKRYGIDKAKAMSVVEKAKAKI